MVCKRQKLARKRFKEANPHLFPKPPEPPKDSSSSSKEKKNKKNKNLKTLQRKTMAKKKSGSALRKHPLRVPGMRPGESCFICKSNDHIAKLCPEKAQWEKNKTTLLAEHERVAPKIEKVDKPGESLHGQRTIHRSGDDLEDDFMEEDVRSGKTDTAVDTGLPLPVAMIASDHYRYARTVIVGMVSIL
ncbi:hypothetical protein COCNU_07G011790 [Cocos nucifera]|uniref:Uncharacterized protein n=1 Tax=Cocos nucifera TaxID=13894 RepID=A0A8K0IGI9_COCNU|nr:hypothetical protein COCNU_07G011790 [Cocos nucifera]